MRKISKQASESFLIGKPFNISNTKVLVRGTTVEMYLFDNMIAYYIIGVNKIHIQNCGWFTQTTKERLSALPNVSIRTIKGIWFLNETEWNGQIKQV
jgi:hypothetical protein